MKTSPISVEEVRDHLIRHHLGRAINLAEVLQIVKDFAAEKGVTLTTVQAALLTHRVNESFTTIIGTEEEMERFFNSVPEQVQLILVMKVMDICYTAKAPLTFAEIVTELGKNVEQDVPAQIVLAARYVLTLMVEEEAIREFIHEDGETRYKFLRMPITNPINA